jgi:hypothetical protein
MVEKIIINCATIGLVPRRYFGLEKPHDPLAQTELSKSIQHDSLINWEQEMEKFNADFLITDENVMPKIARTRLMIPELSVAVAAMVSQSGLENPVAERILLDMLLVSVTMMEWSPINYQLALQQILSFLKILSTNGNAQPWGIINMPLSLLVELRNLLSSHPDTALLGENVVALSEQYFHDPYLLWLIGTGKAPLTRQIVVSNPLSALVTAELGRLRKVNTAHATSDWLYPTRKLLEFFSQRAQLLAKSPKLR